MASKMTILLASERLSLFQSFVSAAGFTVAKTVSGTDMKYTLEFDTFLTVAQQFAVESCLERAKNDVVWTQDGFDLATYQEQHYRTMSENLRAYIYAKFDKETQSKLLGLLAGAMDDVLVNRKTHIRQVDDWVTSMLETATTGFYAKKLAIFTATDKTEVDAVVWDWAADWDDTAPAVSIESALDISD